MLRVGSEPTSVFRRARTLAATAGLALAIGTGGCGSIREQERIEAAKQQQLRSSLNVASVSAKAGQFEAAGRLYFELTRQFPDAPEPRLGLGYLALRNGDFSRAATLFGEAEERSTTSVAKAEALLGAGRASLGEGDLAQAKRLFLAASGPAKDTPVEAWVANGLGVVATLEGDHARARLHYDNAVKLSPSHPMITANLIRALVQTGARDEARRLYDKHSSSHWLEDDDAELAQLLQDTPATEEAVAAVAERMAGSRTIVESPIAADDAPSAASAPAPEGTPVPEETGSAAAPDTRTASASEEPLAQAMEGGREPVATAAASPAEASAPVAASPPTTASDALKGSDGPATPEPATAATTGPPAAEAPTGSGAHVQLYAARSEAEALAVWGRLTNQEKELLGSLTHRIVKADLPEKGVYYRLRVGPLEDRAAAKRLCGQLNGRGRDCFVAAGERPAAGSAAADAGILVQLHASRSRKRALAAWRRLSNAEQDLLDALAPRVVMAQSPEKGVFYRLFTGPFSDMTAARSLCVALKDRGRGCFVRAQ